jgi:hypothetical protein
MRRREAEQAQTLVFDTIIALFTAHAIIVKKKLDNSSKIRTSAMMEPRASAKQGTWHRSNFYDDDLVVSNRMTRQHTLYTEPRKQL